MIRFRKSLRSGCTILALAASLGLAQTALGDAPKAAAGARLGDPITIGEGITFDPMLDARLRWEDVDATSKTADAVTLRTRAGFEVKDSHSHLALLAEAVGTVALDKDYSAFPYAVVNNDQYRPARAVIADPQTAGLNRLQLQYATKEVTLTVGRQRINLDDQRFVGSVGWRQNEQVFDAARAEIHKGAFNLDTTYAIQQHSIYGAYGNPRDYYTGKFIFVNGGIKDGPTTLKGFAYLLDYDNTGFINLPAARSQLDSSQTYGARWGEALPLAKGVMLGWTVSYARQSNYGHNRRAYNVNYWLADGSLTYHNVTANAGYEMMGADARATGGPWSMQTPMATLHGFDGWADVFLTTPSTGLSDTYIGLSGKLPQVTVLPGLKYGVSYHWFGSDLNSTKFGNEVDAQVGFRTRNINWLIKYASYVAKGFGADTKKFWLQADYAF
ncbi:MAG: alginate export family protein [Sphingomonadales bacterium]|nr:alginate export family protein [Sphingomonadales bacterium]MDE2171398.1 alginate export family protein [Sphingomonadales bacterium]